jgi:hypothetical protein
MAGSHAVLTAVWIRAVVTIAVINAYNRLNVISRSQGCDHVPRPGADTRRQAGTIALRG